MNNQVLTINETQQRRGRIMLLSMLVFFIVPILTVILMYKFDWKPKGESLGDLVRPPLQITSPTPLLMADAKPASSTMWSEKWSVVYVAEQCEASCYEKLKDMRQLHVSLYKDIVRAQRVLITKTKNLSKISNDFPDMLIVNQPDDAINQLMTQFKVDDLDPAQSGRLYLVDPLGFLMMSYQTDAPLKNVHNDLKRLLKASWAG
jgi:cytochrome oxidase Cu insertion factor (SCO1/SenC/PrrC family)